MTTLATAVAGVVLALPTGPEPTHAAAVPIPASTTATATASSAAPAVISSWLRVVDWSRPTISHGELLHRYRTLTTLMLRPASTRALPLVVFCHGFDITPRPYLDLLEHWAGAGYVVAAPYFPLTRAGAGRWLDESDVDNQPRDVSAVITSVERSFRDRVDARHVIVVGHSDGGSTSFAVGFSLRNHDRRVSAVMVFSGDLRPRLAPFRAPRRALPFLLIQSNRDELNPVSAAGAVWAVPRAPKYYLHLVGAQHLQPFAFPCPWHAVVEAVTTDFLREWTSSDSAERAAAAAAMRRDAARSVLSWLTART